MPGKPEPLLTLSQHNSIKTLSRPFVKTLSGQCCGHSSRGMLSDKYRAQSIDEAASILQQHGFVIFASGMNPDDLKLMFSPQ